MTTYICAVRAIIKTEKRKRFCPRAFLRNDERSISHQQIASANVDASIHCQVNMFLLIAFQVLCSGHHSGLSLHSHSEGIASTGRPLGCYDVRTSGRCSQQATVNAFNNILSSLFLLSSQNVAVIPVPNVIVNPQWLCDGTTCRQIFLLRKVLIQKVSQLTEFIFHWRLHFECISQFFN